MPLAIGFRGFAVAYPAFFGAINLDLHLLRRHTLFTPPALDPFIALADTGAQAAEVGTVPRPPGPDAEVVGIGNVQPRTAGRAQVHGRSAGTRILPVARKLRERCRQAFGTQSPMTHAEQRSRGRFMRAIAADNPAAAATVADHVPCAGAHAAADEDGPSIGLLDHVGLSVGYGLVLAAQGLLDEAGAVLEKIGMELAAGSGESVKGVEVEVLGQLGDDSSRDECLKSVVVSSIIEMQ